MTTRDELVEAVVAAIDKNTPGEIEDRGDFVNAARAAIAIVVQKCARVASASEIGTDSHDRETRKMCDYHNMGVQHTAQRIRALAGPRP